ncbi:hypothetical protein KSS87_003398 [Heliosperma pusillum]|nr:hypothetical protein KSS87_003398 [Heliosperma pusillum]
MDLDHVFDGHNRGHNIASDVVEFRVGDPYEKVKDLRNVDFVTEFGFDPKRLRLFFEGIHLNPKGGIVVANNVVHKEQGVAFVDQVLGGRRGVESSITTIPLGCRRVQVIIRIKSKVFVLAGLRRRRRPRHSQVRVRGAKVKLQCRQRNTQEVLFESEGVTDATGTYKIYVDKDQQNNVCDTILVSSPHRRCKLPDPGRDRSRVTLTSNNGIVSNERYSNNLGFWMAQPMSFCAKLMKQYELTEEGV